MKNILLPIFFALLAIFLSGCQSGPGKQSVGWFKKKSPPTNHALPDFLAKKGWYTDDDDKYPYADLLSSREINGITWQERKYITDALDEFPKRWLLKDITLTRGPRWLDEHHLALSVRAYPGWEAAPDEPPRIVSFNVDTGAITDSGYRGKIECLNHKGDLMISLDPEPEKSIRVREALTWFIGTWGQPLQEIAWDGHAYVPPYLCRYVQYGDLIHGADIESLPPGAHRILPLLPEHGALKESLTFINGTAYYSTELINPDGIVKKVGMNLPFYQDFIYQPWSDTYFYINYINEPSVTFYPSGELIRHPAPKIIKFWRQFNMFQGMGMGTKKGILWVLRSNTHKELKHGIYLQTQNQLLRIDEGIGGSGTSISPNGCRILSYVKRGNAGAIRETGIKGFMLIDLCNPGDK